MSKTHEKSEKKLDEIYQMVEHRDHILMRPDTYIGSIQADTEEMSLYDGESGRIVNEEITYTPGFFKCFDEILANAYDHTTRDLKVKCKTIKVHISKEDGMIKVWNDGDGIAVEKSDKHNIYYPEMIFGNLLSGTNYNDDEERTGAGRNGYGAKLCNIYAHRFIVETLDTIHGNKKYYQEFRNNMLEKDEPTITKIKGKDSSPYTCITYYPDFEKFNMKDMSDNDMKWMKRRVYDVAACTKKDVKVYFNDEEIQIKTFDDYIKLCYEDEPLLIYNEVNPRWKIGCVFSPDCGNHQTSFVNGTSTYKGGTHVDYIMDQIVAGISNYIKDKEKLTVKSNLIKEHLDLFIDSTIVNPGFSSQTKSELTTKVSKFGSTCIIPKAFITALTKTKLIELVVKNAQFKEQTALGKTDGSKKGMINVPKLEDARWAGKAKKASECRLFLTEGDSAFTYFKAGLEHIGRDKYGGFPLRGKLLNVRKASFSKIRDNEEFIALKKIMGLKQDQKYTDTSQLRYGGIIILTDADSDGSHIKGLIINLFQYFWPELLKLDKFIGTMVTPIIRVWKKTDKAKKEPKEFFSEIKFEEWTKEYDVKKYDVKYYKGLGTSDNKTARKSFVDFEDKGVTWYTWDNPQEFLEKNKDEKQDSDNDNDNNNDNNDNEMVNSNNSDSDNQSDDDNSDDDSDDEQKGGAVKAKKVKGKKGKLEVVITDPQILNSKSYDRITLAFDETRAHDRKKWLKKYKRDNILDYDTTNRRVTYSSFIDKDLIHFSNYDNIRSIPSIVDGFKPSQRKIMYICLEDNIKKDIKVIDLASEVSKRTAYKHGNTSLEETIVGMAQDYTGTNNINLLYPNGNFGNRWAGGNDVSSSRYIFTFMENITPKIFLKEDSSILNYLQEDGKLVEPETFFPVLPTVLTNGSAGIGTGFATAIPQYNPKDICNNLLNMMDGKPAENMIPWYNGYKGEISEEKNAKTGRVYYRSIGLYNTKDGSTLDITELPIGNNKCYFPRDYEEKLLCPMSGIAYITKDEKKDGKKKKKNNKKKPKIDEILDKYFNNCGLNDVNFELSFKGNEMIKLRKNGTLQDKLKLATKISIDNMYLYNTKGKLTKYNSPIEILEEFYEYRLKVYGIRKEHYMKLLDNELEILKNKVKYIEACRSKDAKAKINVAECDSAGLIKQIADKGLPKLSYKVGASEDEKSYDYLTDMKITSLTTDKIAELKKKYEEKKEEHDDYGRTTPKQLWKRELEIFMKEYDKWLIEKEERNNDDDLKDKKKKTKKKK
jgi:DNA topoisomerase II